MPGSMVRLLVSVLSVGIPLLVAGILLRVFTAGDRVKIPADLASGPVTLYGHLVRPGQLIGSAWDGTTYGTVTLSGGDFCWDGSDGVRWAAPIPSIGVLGVAGAMSLTQPSVTLGIAGSGEWVVVVSDRPINRYLRNSAKRMREARTALRLAELLIGAGAQDLRTR